MKKSLVLLAALPFALPAAAFAQSGNTASGSHNGMNWQAQSMIVGVTPTTGAGQDPRYFPQRPFSNGVVALIMQTTAGNFICSGTLLNDRRSIATAAHCVSDGAGTANPIATTAYFYGGPNPDLRIVNAGAPGVELRSVSDYFVNPDYTGEVIDENDIAILRLAEEAPDFATSFGLYTQGDLTGLDFNVQGYGNRSTVGGNVGATPGTTGVLRQGDNRYDFRLGDERFNGFFTDRDANGEAFFGFADAEFSYVSDFDNGLAANDASCLVGINITGGTDFCNLGRGASEVGIAGGDSGGPQFINGLLAGVNSYGLSFGPAFGDINAQLNSSFGEFSGYVPIFIHEQFINGVLVPTGPGVIPEPASWAMMIAGFGLVGGAMRRSSNRKVTYSVA